MINTRSIDITPDKTLLEKLGSVGFTPEEAVAEFVDNAIDAQYDRSGNRLVPLAVTVDVTLSRESITIRDDAAGIEDFDRCMKAAWSDKSGATTLGLFGLGLKTASMSLGRRVTITSKRLGETVVKSTTLDLDHWYADASWILTVEESTQEPKSHFTQIKIEKLYVDPSMYLEELRDRLADRFGPFFDCGDAFIRINGGQIAPTPVR